MYRYLGQVIFILCPNVHVISFAHRVETHLKPALGLMNCVELMDRGRAADVDFAVVRVT